MLPQSSLLALIPLLAALPANGFYTKNSPVLQLNQKTYGSLIADSNYTSVVEFYAPWCGHCQNLKPAYEKAAQNLKGLAKVAAVNCDEDENKPFCGQMGVKGFPTIKIVTPSKKPGKPRVEDYQGARSAKGIVEAVVDRIPNHVKRVTDKDFDQWLEQNGERPKAILFTEKGTTTPLIRALAIDFLGAVDVAQIRNKESASVQKFGVTKFPTLVVIPDSESEPKVYEGELKKQPIADFLKHGQGQEVQALQVLQGGPQGPSRVPEDDESTPDAEPTPEAKPAEVPIVPPIPSLDTSESLQSSCLGSKSATCVLVLLPASAESEAVLPTTATHALASLSEIAHRHQRRGTHLFPIYRVPADNSASQNLRQSLGLGASDAMEIVAVNARRGWFRRYDYAENSGLAAAERWIDAIRLGEGAKEKLPEGVVVEAPAEAEKAETEAGSEEATGETAPEEVDQEAKEEPKHDEL
ncbi:putative disulfide-isomerase [Penicillium oxalicum]|uniref:putative disulfide-isomerase n=1 Tax=Penicillium oxalicum TaxID=69781 RepID=UPI0020B72579|nr:putative disulfide-isomerase [Penicillium oxalicum]KAI2788993.1 putative disulfide-isomerase [Penicillium oxalicum]